MPSLSAPLLIFTSVEGPAVAILHKTKVERKKLAGYRIRETMTQQNQRTVDPSTLSLPSPSPDPLSPKPATSSSSGPSRKRPRTDASPEEKKEARAHRNRIAAQNSRDKRKAQFSQLEAKVQELEKENRQLRLALSSNPGSSSVAVSAREQEWIRENQQLKDRIRTLETGWADVLKALSAAGHAIPALSALSQPTSSENKPTSSVIPEVAPPTPTSPSLPTSTITKTETCSSRGPAAGGRVDSTDLVADNVDKIPSETETEAQIESWFQEILQPIPSSPASTSSASLPSLDAFDGQTSMVGIDTGMEEAMNIQSMWKWDEPNDEEMRTLLDLLPAEMDVIPSTLGLGFDSAIERSWLTGSNAVLDSEFIVSLFSPFDFVFSPLSLDIVIVKIRLVQKDYKRLNAWHASESESVKWRDEGGNVARRVSVSALHPKAIFSTNTSHPVASEPTGTTTAPAAAPVEAGAAADQLEHVENGLDKGKGKAVASSEPHTGDVDMDEDSEDEEGQEDGEGDEDDVDMIEEDELEAIDPSTILAPGSRRSTRGNKVDYSSEEAYKAAGLKKDEDDDDEDEFAAKEDVEA
ncbi:hypothetical protein SISSUDRAFT_1118073 [Sistotremastrum suecicum HHB10207 ss-3]|uniref:X-box-binding protein 1 n=1 Tax=Sistotremastrum suecicum HHB10207 ss-3 TaxID=1314776 RepID=A0A166FM37_9AGAM|nr:hypothetical protein SISSUDRAFT_1118073 [Sistotremastrum suecicum HHB10207 ss-3]